MTNLPIEPDLLKYLVQFPILSHPQCDALATLAASLKPSHRLVVIQTDTDSGGRHTYVHTPQGEFHVALNGNTLKMGVIEEGGDPPCPTHG